MGAISRLTFTGVRVDWVTVTGPSEGKATLMIDGVSIGTVDLYSSAVHWKAVKSYSGLAYGSHTIVVKVLGTKNAAANSTSVIVDAFLTYT